MKRSVRRACLRVMKSVGSKSAQGASPSTIPDSPAIQRSSSGSTPTPNGVTAPSPVITTGLPIGARHHQVDQVADGPDVLDVVALQVDLELVLDDLRHLDEIERVDVEGLQGRLTRDLVALGADLGQAVRDHALD